MLQFALSLELNREVDFAASELYRGWTEPELVVKWFTPRLWSTASAKLDVRPGGVIDIVIYSPDGEGYPNLGVYLEVIPNEEFVWMNALSSEWIPKEEKEGGDQLLMVVTISFEALGLQRTRYFAQVAHWSEADRLKHEAMGFFTGWNVALDQLIDVLKA